jgi:hypothetical protein
MATYSKEFLSGGTGDGLGIKVVATATAGTTIHTAHATAQDEIHLWAWNTDTVNRVLTVEFGGATDPDDLIEMDIPFQDGLYLVVPGLPLTNLVVKAFAAAANIIVVHGFVNRLT